MRKLLDKYGVYVVAGIIVLAGAIWYVFGRSSSHIPHSAFFIDEDTGQESVRSVDDVPPLIGAKGNPSIVKVFKYNCEDDKTVRVGYYIKFPPDMKAKMVELIRHPDPASLLEPGNAMLIRTPESGPGGWVRIKSAEGEKIVESLHCPSGNPMAIYP